MYTIYTTIYLGSVGPFLSIRTKTGKLPYLVLRMRSGLGILYLEYRCQGWEWILISPTNETGTEPYLDPWLSTVPGNFHWSCK